MYRAGSGKRSACMEPCCSFCSRLSSFFFPSFLSFLLVPFLSRGPFHIKLRFLGCTAISPIRSGLSLANTQFLVCSEMKITLFMIGLMQKFSDTRVCSVTDCPCDAHWYGISEKKKRQYGLVPAKGVPMWHTIHATSSPARLP